MVFWRYYRYTTFLLWVLRACLATKKISTCKKILMFISISKIHLVIHFIFEISYFKESCNLIRRKNFGQKLKKLHFARIWDCWLKTNKNFVVDYFQGKLTTKLFKRNPKNVILFWDHFAQVLGKMDFPGKKGLSLFSNIPITYHHAKKIRKNYWPIPEKNDELTDGRTDERCPWQTFY